MNNALSKKRLFLNHPSPKGFYKETLYIPPKSGEKLSRKEMNYLRKYNPYMYHQMVRVQQKREALKERLKHCRSKEEAQQAIGAAFSSIHEKDPVKCFVGGGVKLKC